MHSATSHEFTATGAPPRVRIEFDVAKLDEQIRRLTPRQKDCLRLVTRGHQSKSIARELGISSQRVDKHIAEARRILGTPSRSEAARLLCAWEQQRDASTAGILSGAPSFALSNESDGPSKHDRDLINGGVAQQPFPASRRQEEGAPVDSGDETRSRSFGIERSADHEARKPSAFAFYIAVVAVLTAIGAVASLLFALDWFGRS